MKKKAAVVLTTVLCFAICMFAFAACNKPSGDDGKDKAEGNAEFVAYREKVVTVLRDNGIRVNDVTAQNNGVKNGGGTFSSTPVKNAVNRKNELFETVAAADKQEDYAAANSERESIFEQTLSIALIVGDAISNYYGEKQFYGIPIYFEGWKQYFEIVKHDGNDLARIYTPADSANFSSVLTMELKFASASDYAFTCIQIRDDQVIYAYGNAQKEYIMFALGLTAGADTFGYYLPDSTTGYTFDDVATVETCYNAVRDEIDTVDKSAIEALPTRVKHNITEKQQTDVLEKYFGESGFHGIRFADDGSPVLYGGKKVALEYYADGESVVELPTDEEYYLIDRFTVRDETATVKELVIPSNVLGIVKQPKESTARFEFTAATVNDVDLAIYLDLGEGNGEYKPFEKITVRGTSPIFQTGSGHLRDKSGKIVYVCDSAMPALDTAARFTFDIEQYPNLLTSITSIELDLAKLWKDPNQVETEEAENAFVVLAAGMTKMPNLATIELSSVHAPEMPDGHAQRIDLSVILRKDLTVNIGQFDNGNLGLNLQVDTVGKHTLTVNAPTLPAGVPPIFYPTPYNLVSVGDGVEVDAEFDRIKRDVSLVVNTSYSESIFQTAYHQVIFTENFTDVTIHYGTSGGLNGFTVTEFNNSSGNEILSIVMDTVSNGATVSVPSEFCGVQLKQLWLDADDLADKTVTINLPNIEWFTDGNGLTVRFVTRTPNEHGIGNGYYESALENENTTLVIGCTKTDVMQYVTILYDTEYAYRLSAQCTDGITVLQGNATNSKLNFTFIIGNRLYRKQYRYDPNKIILPDEWLAEIDNKEQVKFSYKTVGGENWQGVSQCLSHDIDGWNFFVQDIVEDMIFQYIPDELQTVTVTFSIDGNTQVKQVSDGKIDFDSSPDWLQNLQDGYFEWEGLQFTIERDDYKDDMCRIICPIEICFDITLTWVQN